MIRCIYPCYGATAVLALFGPKHLPVTQDTRGSLLNGGATQRLYVLHILVFKPI